MIKSLNKLAYTLKLEIREINKIINNIDKYYYEFDSKNAKRKFNPSKGRLKEIQHRILKEILEKIPIPTYAFGAVKKRSNVLNAKMHQGNKYFFLTDLKKFFPSINPTMVYKTFIFYGFSADVSHLLTGITTYQGKLPQGTHTSPYISNLVFALTGIKILKICEQKGLTFTSYIDDLTVSSKNDFKGTEQEIIELIVGDGFRISHKKTFYKTKLPMVTKIPVGNNGLKKPPEIVNKIKRAKEIGNYEKVTGLENYLKSIDKINKTRKRKLFKKGI